MLLLCFHAGAYTVHQWKGLQLSLSKLLTKLHSWLSLAESGNVPSITQDQTQCYMCDFHIEAHLACSYLDVFQHLYSTGLHLSFYIYMTINHSAQTET